MKIFLPSLFICLSLLSFSQKKTLTHSDIQSWKTIENESISHNGNHVVYDLQLDNSDSHLILKTSNGDTVLEHERASQGKFSYDSNFLTFTIKPWKDSIKDMQRRKVKKSKMPKDTLAIYNIKTKELTKIANVKSYKMPEKWSGYLAYLLEDVKKEDKKTESDSSSTKEKDKKKKTKKVGKKNGYHLVVHDLSTTAHDTFKYVTNYTFAKVGEKIAFTTTGDIEDKNAGVFVLDFNKEELTNIHNTPKTKYSKMGFSESGNKFAFVADADTTKIQIRPNVVYTWQEGSAIAKKLIDNSSAPEGYLVSSNGDVSFSKDESKLYFGLRVPPVIKDTTLLKDEIVNVEVWTYNEPRLYTVQELQVKNDTVKSYQAVYNYKSDKIIQIGEKYFPNVSLTDKGNSNLALANTTTPYELESQWTGRRLRDYAIINTDTGSRKTVLKGISRASLSPKAKYLFGYNEIDSTWFTYNTKTDHYKALTKGKGFYNELQDTPNYPRSYGLAGWTEDDEHILIYDRFDIWKFNPDTGAATNLTNGRDEKIVYRYVELDDEADYINSKSNWLISVFDENTKSSGFSELNPKNNSIKQLKFSPHRYSRPNKAQLSNKLIFTKESFTEFPDLRVTDLKFKNETLLSDANPQQNDYLWGNNELVNWTSLDGIPLTGMLVKPENFDPNKKYPMIVNFYERSSDGLHRHRPPSYVRSTISYSYYANQGYIIFNPDVVYREGYPGESAFNCVIAGVNALIEKGFVDEDNIGVQGHSWGGYQIAYLVTKTDIFKAAESGAPVPNMISAYGGIRWWTGLSRQFQYEHTQSRIGGTPWEYPMRYIENSPIFNIDKINTPLLIMHNDADGHVPWYQGIEFFVSLRRLSKPSWFLNYNGEPHWPLKYQNRKDFTLRMSQFFDYYLKGKPMPIWMDRGVPAIEKGVNQGYELKD
ncbi:alpha/beta hydrolase family protein [Algibacter aquimarinus]|uniref:Prolyl oligopeptidase family serine peptidase n=1 Tax=Algibacter aquimarinus TaxID=1136748 RepID=A0ABP9HEZ3_9FLAO